MKKLLLLLLITASFLKTEAGAYYAPIVSNDGSPIKKETIIAFVFGRKTSQSITVYVSREVYKNSLENQLSVRKLAYPQYYNADMTLEQWLNKLEWVAGSKFNQQWYKNTGVNKTTGALEILTSLYSDWGSLPATLHNGNTIGYWCYVYGTFVDPVIKDNCGNIIFSNIPVKPLEEDEEQPQKEYATLPCSRERIEMGEYDTEEGVTYGRLSADGMYYYRNRDKSWHHKNAAGGWDSIVCPVEETQIIETHRKIVKLIQVVDTVREYRETTATVYSCRLHYNCNGSCQQYQYQQQPQFFVQQQRSVGVSVNFSSNPQRQFFYEQQQPQQYRGQAQQIDWRNSRQFDGGEQYQNQNNWTDPYPFGGGNQNQNDYTNQWNGTGFGGGGGTGSFERVGG